MLSVFCVCAWVSMCICVTCFFVFCLFCSILVWVLLGFVFCLFFFFSKEGEKEDIELDGWGGGEDLRGKGENCVQNVMYEKKSVFNLKKLVKVKV